ncbi:MAG: octanoyltransferase LipM [Gemmatimonadaceae bacterium]
MALDDALRWRTADTGEAVLRVYGWLRPTLSLGRNQASRGRYALDRMCEEGVDVVRRPTGGRAVLHDREVTYSVTTSAPPGTSPAESYDRVNRLLVDGLRHLGIDATIASRRAPTPLPDATPCFTTPTSGEIIVGRRKLVGSAQVHEGGVILQHGSILIENDQSRVSTYSLDPPRSFPSPATLRELMGRAPTLEEVANGLFAAVKLSHDADAQELPLDAPLIERAERLRHHYEDDAWTWRR